MKASVVRPGMVYTVPQVIDAAPARLTWRKVYCWIHSRFRKVDHNGYHIRLTPAQALELLIVAELRRKGIKPQAMRGFRLMPPPEADYLLMAGMRPAWINHPEQAIKRATKARSGVLLVSVADLRKRLASAC